MRWIFSSSGELDDPVALLPRGQLDLSALTERLAAHDEPRVIEQRMLDTEDVSLGRAPGGSIKLDVSAVEKA